MHAFCRNAIHFELLYSGFLLSNVETFNIQNFSRTAFRFKGNIVLQDMDVRFPAYSAQYGSTVPAR